MHVPLTESTKGLLGEAQLAMMKSEAVIINAARGGVLDEAALLRRLQEKRLAGAALDVFELEPLPADHPLRKLPNVVLTPSPRRIHRRGPAQRRAGDRSGDSCGAGAWRSLGCR
jgi:phosphoglycerate dehydrogenase-like enzyme